MLCGGSVIACEATHLITGVLVVYIHPSPVREASIKIPGKADKILDVVLDEPVRANLSYHLHLLYYHLHHVFEFQP